MSLLSDYRKDISKLLNAADIEQSLIDQGMAPDVAKRVATSKAMVAQASLPKKGTSQV
jgi:hypothetical protein